MKEYASDISLAELRQLVDSYFDSSISEADGKRLRDFALSRPAHGALPPELEADLRLIASLSTLAAAEEAGLDVEVPSALSDRWNEAVARAAEAERAAAAPRHRVSAFSGKMTRRLIASAASVAVMALIGWQFISRHDDLWGVKSDVLARSTSVLKTEVSQEQDSLVAAPMAGRQLAVNAVKPHTSRKSVAPAPVTPPAEETPVLSSDQDSDENLVFLPATATLPAEHDSRFMQAAQVMESTSSVISDLGKDGIATLSMISDALEDLFVTPVPAEETEPQYLPI